MTAFDEISYNGTNFLKPPEKSHYGTNGVFQNVAKA